MALTWATEHASHHDSFRVSPPGAGGEPAGFSRRVPALSPQPLPAARRGCRGGGPGDACWRSRAAPPAGALLLLAPDQLPEARGRGPESQRAGGALRASGRAGAPCRGRWAAGARAGWRQARGRGRGRGRGRWRRHGRAGGRGGGRPGQGERAEGSARGRGGRGARRAERARGGARRARVINYARSRAARGAGAGSAPRWRPPQSRPPQPRHLCSPAAPPGPRVRAAAASLAAAAAVSRPRAPALALLPAVRVSLLTSGPLSGARPSPVRGFAAECAAGLDGPWSWGSALLVLDGCLEVLLPSTVCSGGLLGQLRTTSPHPGHPALSVSATVRDTARPWCPFRGAAPHPSPSAGSELGPLAGLHWEGQRCRDLPTAAPQLYPSPMSYCILLPHPASHC